MAEDIGEDFEIFVHPRLEAALRRAQASGRGPASQPGVGATGAPGHGCDVRGAAPVPADGGVVAETRPTWRPPGAREPATTWADTAAARAAYAAADALAERASAAPPSHNAPLKPAARRRGPLRTLRLKACRL
eukprot:9900045-Alexandrium_andersonii.AAC.1